MVSSYGPAFYVMMLILLALAAGWIGSIFFLGKRRHWVWATVVFFLGAAGPFWLVVFFFHPFGPVGTLRILDRAEAPDHTRLVLTQSRNEGFTEPYSISLWVKPPGKTWGFCYIDHEDSWWRRGSIGFVRGGRQAQVFRGAKPVINLDLKSLKYDFFTPGSEREAGDWKPESWEPREGGI